VGSYLQAYRIEDNICIHQIMCSVCVRVCVRACMCVCVCDEGEGEIGKSQLCCGEIHIKASVKTISEQTIATE